MSTARRMLVILVILVLLGRVLTACRAGAEGTPTPSLQPSSTSPNPTGGKSWSSPPPMTIDPEKTYTATLKTEKGDVKLELWPKVAPKAVNNLVFLARQGFYDNITFHRVMHDFMARRATQRARAVAGQVIALRTRSSKS